VEEFYLRLLAINERTLGPEHPNVADVLNHLGSLYTDVERLSEAERCLRQALAIQEKSLPPDEPSIAQTLVHQARLLRKMGREAEADAVEARARETPPENPTAH
jgi:tetratricopeptide (TPR) repeat protein